MISFYSLKEFYDTCDMYRRDYIGHVIFHASHIVADLKNYRL